jgi:hypothetical protein
MDLILQTMTLINGRPDVSSERASHMDRTVTFIQEYSILAAAPAKQGSPHHWQFSKTHTGSRHAHGFPLAVRL